MGKCDVCKRPEESQIGRGGPLRVALVRIEGDMAYPQTEIKDSGAQRGFEMHYPRSKVAHIKCHNNCDPNIKGHGIKIK